MVSSTLCTAVHILGSQNVYGRAEDTADHYWPWAVFFKILLKCSFTIVCYGEKCLQLMVEHTNSSQFPLFEVTLASMACKS